jgi:hypothetical protein|tara:strand:+ start:3774 stop:4028 length:255 start_codon:yes stop_codon:yes gene_type:complete
MDFIGETNMVIEMLIFTVVLVGASYQAYVIGKTEGKKDASQEAMIGTLIFARDKMLLKSEEDIVWQYLNDDMELIVRMVVERKI